MGGCGDETGPKRPRTALNPSNCHHHHSTQRPQPAPTSATYTSTLTPGGARRTWRCPDDGFIPRLVLERDRTGEGYDRARTRRVLSPVVCFFLSFIFLLTNFIYGHAKNYHHHRTAQGLSTRRQHPGNQKRPTRRFIPSFGPIYVRHNDHQERRGTKEKSPNDGLCRRLGSK